MQTRRIRMILCCGAWLVMLFSLAAGCNDATGVGKKCIDADGDGYGENCEPGADCDDSDNAIHPGAIEVCGDGVDQDCSGADLECGCEDADSDGHEDEACGGDDCDDADDSVHPGADEVCGDGVDQDCSGADLACGCEDADSDGHEDEACGGDDCDDGDAGIHPGADEICDDGIDQDCSGADEVCGCADADGDGHQDETCGGDDCDDADPFVHTGANEICGDGVDQDCDGDDPVCPCPDADGDGFLDEACGGTDCNDAHPGIHPGATETCDGVDNDCAGGADDGLSPDCLPCDDVVHPACSPGEVRACGSDTGECVSGVETCDATGEWSGVCDGEVGPTGELQNGLDDNCDGTADEGLWAISTPCPDAGATWRVAQGAAPGGDGLTWATAFATLEEALTAAANCDEVWVSGTLLLVDTITIDSPIRIYGGFAGDEASRDERDPVANPTTIDGGGSVHCLSISAGTLLDGLTVTGCYEETVGEGGAVDLRAAQLYLREVVFTNNTVWDPAGDHWTMGGAVFATAGASLVAESSRFEGNLSRWNGGAVYAEDSDVLVHDTWFLGNSTDYGVARGGAIMALGTGTVAVNGSTFERNFAYDSGDAIFVQGPDLYVLGCEFYENVSEGVLVKVWGSTAVLHDSHFQANGTLTSFPASASTLIGADHEAILTISACDFVDNDALALLASLSGQPLVISDSNFSGNYGSITASGAALTVSNSRIERDRHWYNTVHASGIQDPWGVVTFSRCTFADNQGSGLYLNWVDAFVDRSVLVRNAGHFLGGALELDAYADLIVTNSLIADNYCEQNGAAAYVDDHSTLHLEHVTLVNNAMNRVNGAAIRAEYYSDVTATNILMWANWPLPASRENTCGAITPTHSVVPDRPGWDAVQYENLIVEPDLVDPGNDDYRLASWSPALDAGVPGALTVDLDGRLRSLDGDGDGNSAPDPGAYEFVAEVENLPPIAMALDGLRVCTNHVPLSDTSLFAGKTCDPNGDLLDYSWYGPHGALSGTNPEALLPLGTSLLTLIVQDGELSSEPHTIRVQVEPCLELAAARSGSDAVLSWSGPAIADVYRATGADPTRFVRVAQAASTGHLDAPADGVDLALYAIIAEGQASNVAAVFVGDAPPANADPVIWSIPSDYGDYLPPAIEPLTLVTARHGIPYGYHLQAVDPDGDPLGFSLVEGPAGAELGEDGLFVWTPDQTGQHPVTIEVSDGRGGTATQAFTLQVDNRAPVADAGRDFTLAATGEPLVLDGSGSADPDGDPLAYSWALISAPTDSLANLSDPNAAQPEFIPDIPGRYTLALVVDDGALTSAPDTVFVETLNLRPITDTNYRIHPGDYESTHWRGELVQLDGSGSWDPEGRPLSFSWTMLHRPAGSQAVLSDPTDPRPTFVADVFGEYDLALTVSDGELDSFPRYAFIAARNRDPIADPGPDRNAAIGETLSFDCSRSYDPDGDPIVCEWGLWPPAGSAAVIIGGGAQTWIESYDAAFVPDIPGTYYMSHRVTDPEGEIGWVDAIVTVQAGTNPPVISTAPGLSAVVGQAWAYDADADDADAGDTATWSLVMAPAGMAVVPGTGEVSWTPTGQQVGDRDVVLRVTDTAGLYDEQAFTLAVTLEAQPPRIGCPSTLSVVAGSTLAQELRAYDPNGDALTFDKVSGPAAATVSDGYLEWATVPADAGSHAVVARVSDGGLDDTCTIAITVVDLGDDDGDFDGYSEAEGDCDDDDPAVHPGAWDVAGDGIDQDCAGGDAARSVAVDAPSSTVDLLVGESVWIPHVLYADRPGGGSEDIDIVQGVVPVGGLLLESDLAGLTAVNESQTRVATAKVTAEVPGDYLLVTTVTDTATGQEAVASTPVRVLAGTTVARMLAPGFFPPALTEGEAALVNVAVRMERGDPAPAYVWLDRTDAVGTPLEGIGWLLDNGEGADLAAGDGVFSGTILVEANPEGTLWYRAHTDVDAGAVAVTSEIGALAVTRFPIGPPASDLDDVVFDPVSGSPLLAGQVSVRFAAGTTPDQIEAAAADLGAEVTGFLAGLDVYVLSLPPLTSGDELPARLAAIEAHPDIDQVTPSGVVQIEAVGVTDSIQLMATWANTVHTDIAWVFSFSGASVSVAVVDTGVDGFHPELAPNITPGWNFFTSGTNVQDDNAHGTQVAGIIAADSNSHGFAGILPDANLKIFKSFNEEGRSTTELMVYSTYLAAMCGATLINASFGEFRAKTDPLLMELMDEMVAGSGSLLVAAAGNENTNRPLFPAANFHSLAVGGVGLNNLERWVEGPHGGSNHGTWVDIAAPAEDVFTTVPTTPTESWDPDQFCFDFEENQDNPPLLPDLASRRAVGCYAAVDGTSLATPIVVGTAGMILERFPHYTASQVRERLEVTAVPLTHPSTRGLGHGRLDSYQAVFNGSFEAAEVPDRALALAISGLINQTCVEWVETENWGGLFALDRPCYERGFSPPDNHGWHLLRWGGIPYQPFRTHDWVPGGVRVRELGPIRPVDGKYMAMLSTGRGAQTPDSIYGSGEDYWNAQYLDILEQRFTIAPGQTELIVTFMYDFVTEEAPFAADRLDWPDPDYFTAVLDINGRREVIEVHNMWEMEFTAALTGVDGLILSGYPARHTGWKTGHKVISIDPSETGPMTIRFTLGDDAGRDLDSILLIDDVHVD